MNKETQINYSSDYQNPGSKEIHETLDPFKRDYPKHVKNFSRACSKFINAKTEKRRKFIAKNYGFDYGFLKGFCKNKYDYKS